jgi:addiction module HigA family antidote
VVSPPGDTLQETLENIGMTQMELAERTGRPLKTINEIIKGKAAITPETALQLERVLGTPARFWNNRERHYREYLARQEEAERLARQTDWMDGVPVTAMIKLKWIEKQSAPVEHARAVLNFFGVATPETYLKLCVGDQVAYRRSPAMEGQPAAVAAWLRQGELEAREIEWQPYDERKFRALLPRLRALTLTRDPAQFVPELQRLCAECGVVVVFIPEIPGKQGTRLCGAARWLTPEKALIQLSVRYKDDGNLWFTFFHEAAHILLHSKKAFFVDDKVGEGEDEQEAEADTFARNLLIPPSALQKFIAASLFTDAAIRRFSEEIGIAPGIVVGRLQHDQVIGWHIGNSLKARYQWTDDSDKRESC